MIPDSVLAAIFPLCHILVIIFMIKMKQLQTGAADPPLF
ncbi:hypothetical protein N037_13175 [Enterobacter sp. EGD-HP1]|nr:hypothetical protein N037_13175 [Enterobacter sp. EGD-HP1]